MPNSSRIAAALSLLALAAVPFGLAGQTRSTPPPQAPAAASSSVPTPSRPGKVYLSGENPWIFLSDTPGGAARTQVSVWRIHWSPVGPGHVCFVIIGDAQAPGAVRVALYDSKPLLDYLTNDVLGTYNASYLERPFTPVGGATFAAGGDSITERREICKSATHSVELVWRDLGAAGLVDILPGSRASNPFGITYLRIPAGRAEVRYNGRPAPGLSVPNESFLAFGETWIK